MADFNTLFAGRERANRDAGNERVKITYLHYQKLAESPLQYRKYDRKALEDMADIIAADGMVLQNLVVRRIDADQYEIIAGHKRRAASRILVEERGLEKYAFLPCVIRKEDDVHTRFSVVSTNVRPPQTPYETLHEIEEMRKLLLEHPDAFPDMKGGRMVERLAEQLHMSRSTVSEYRAISNNLGEKGMEAFKDGRLEKSAAVALAGLPDEEQERLIEEGKLTHKEIHTYKQEKKASGQKRSRETEKPNADCQEESSIEHVPGQPHLQQPELELMKNDAEREAFVDGYQNWKIWIDTEETGERYYRYDLPDGSSFVVKVYFHKCFDYAMDKPLQERYREGWGAEEYYILEKGEYFRDCKTNRSALAEHLRRMQK